MILINALFTTNYTSQEIDLTTDTAGPEVILDPNQFFIDNNNSLALKVEGETKISGHVTPLESNTFPNLTLENLVICPPEC